MSEFTSKSQLARRSPKSNEKKVSKEILLLKPRLCREMDKNDEDKLKNTFKVSLSLRPVKQELRLKETSKLKTVTKQLLERRPMSPISSSSGYESELHDSDSDSCASYFQEKYTSEQYCEECFSVAVHSRFASQLPLPRTDGAGLWSTHTLFDRFGRLSCPRLLEAATMNDPEVHRYIDKIMAEYSITNNYGKFYGGF
ncbi:unnamed protein product [Auanema sp. JU1783]|nr:unnamed protein product [Auanema sp. JU1783]